jgi:hypothetical protein
MAYQKLQVSTGRPVIPNDDIDIPTTGSPSIESTQTLTPFLNTVIVDDTQDFTSVPIGSTVITNGQLARVIKINDPFSLSISPGISDTTGTNLDYEIYSAIGSPNPGCVLYSGSGGDIRVLTSSNADLTFVGFPPGTFMPVQVKRVFATGTAATDIIALW